MIEFYSIVVMEIEHFHTVMVLYTHYNRIIILCVHNFWIIYILIAILIRLYVNIKFIITQVNQNWELYYTSSLADCPLIISTTLSLFNTQLEANLFWKSFIFMDTRFRVFFFEKKRRNFHWHMIKLWISLSMKISAPLNIIVSQ